MEHRLFGWHTVLQQLSTTSRLRMGGVERGLWWVGWFSTLLGPEDSNILVTGLFVGTWASYPLMRWWLFPEDGGQGLRWWGLWLGHHGLRTAHCFGGV